jgi:hypothetical protein
MPLFSKKSKSFLCENIGFSLDFTLPKSVGNETYFLEILRHFLASSGEYNSFYAPKNERTVSY